MHSAIQIDMIPSREINQRHELFFHADDRFKQNSSHYWLIYAIDFNSWLDNKSICYPIFFLFSFIMQFI